MVNEELAAWVIHDAVLYDWVNHDRVPPLLIEDREDEAIEAVQFILELCVSNHVSHREHVQQNMGYYQALELAPDAYPICRASGRKTSYPKA